jgi:hypothetical protein
MRGAAFAALALCLAILVAGCGGSGNGLPHRADLVVEVMHDTLGYADVEGPSTARSMTLETIDRTQPRTRYLRVVVWGSWADANRLLTGTASSTTRPVGYCRQRARARTCVVADRVTAAGAPGAGTPAVVRLARALYWGGVPGGVRWTAKSM